MERSHPTRGAGGGPGQLFGAALALALCLACGGPSATARIELRAVLGRADSTAVTRVVVVVSAADLPPRTLVLTDAGGTYAGTFAALPVGLARVFAATAFDANDNAIYQGSSTVDLAPDTAPQVTVILQQTPAPPVLALSAPHIDGLTISGQTVATGGRLQLTASASGGAAGATLTPAWTAADGAGSFSAPGLFGTDWIAPATAGIAQLTLTVGDGTGAEDYARLSVAVLDAPAAPADLAVSLAPNAATLSWTEVPLASAYQVAWTATPGGARHPCADVLAPAASATCADLPSGANLFLCVRASLSGVDGAWSDPLGATIP